jgi:hypothetical protein
MNHYLVSIVRVIDDQKETTTHEVNAISHAAAILATLDEANITELPATAELLLYATAADLTSGELDELAHGIIGAWREAQRHPGRLTQEFCIGMAERAVQHPDPEIREYAQRWRDLANDVLPQRQGHGLTPEAEQRRKEATEH